MRRARAGQTLIEMLIGFLLLSLLLVTLFLVYRTGASAWKKTEAQTQLLQEAQIVNARLARAAERTVFASVSVDPGPTTGTAVALMSCWDQAAGRYDYDALNRSPIWHSYLIFYYDSASGTVCTREEPFSPSTVTPAPLAALNTLRTGGQTLASNVTRCDFTLSQDMLQLELELQRKRYGSEDLEVVQLPSSVFFRN